MCSSSTNWERAASPALPTADSVQILNAAQTRAPIAGAPNHGLRLWTMPGQRTPPSLISRSIVRDRLRRALGTASTFSTGYFG